LLARRKTTGVTDLGYWRIRFGKNKTLKSFLGKLLSQKVQTKAKRITEHVSGGTIDWTRTKAYVVPIYFHVCGIEINTVKERRDGIVQSGTEYENIRTQIIDASRTLLHPETKKPIILNAYRREELYSGRWLKDIPDIIFELDPDYVPIDSLASSEFIEIAPSPFRPGEHRQDGIFIAAGSHIQVQDELLCLNLIDVPPTAHFASGIAIPSTFDGHVISEIFTPEYLADNPITIYEHTPNSIALEAPISETDELELTERLRGLGYLN